MQGNFRLTLTGAQPVSDTHINEAVQDVFGLAPDIIYKQFAQDWPHRTDVHLWHRDRIPSFAVSYYANGKQVADSGWYESKSGIGQRPATFAHLDVRQEKFWVADDWQRLGVGRVLFGNRIAFARASTLIGKFDCRCSPNSSSYWARAGYVLDGERATERAKENVSHNLSVILAAGAPLPRQARDTIDQALASKAPEWLWQIADIDTRVGREKLGEVLLYGVSEWLSLDVRNDAQSTRAAEFSNTGRITLANARLQPA